MRDLSSTVWDTLLIKASSPEADSRQKQTQTYAEKVRQEVRRHTQRPLFVWTSLVLIRSLQQRSNTVGTQTAQSLSTYWAGTPSVKPHLRRSSILQAGQIVQSGHQENHTEHGVTRKMIARSRSTWSNRGRAQVRRSTDHGHGTRASSVSGRAAEDVKIMVKVFLAEIGVHSMSNTWMGLSHRLKDRHTSVLLVNAGSSRALELLVKRVAVGSACPHHHPCPQHLYVKYKHG